MYVAMSRFLIYVPTDQSPSEHSLGSVLSAQFPSVVSSYDISSNVVPPVGIH